MRICFVGHQASKEGAGRFMLDQIDYLLQHDVTVFAIVPEWGPLCDELVQRRVEIAVVPNALWNLPGALKARDYEEAVVASRGMAGLFRQWAIDVVYTETSVVIAGALGAALAALPHVWHLHEFSYNPRAIEMALPRDTLARLMDLTSNFVFFNSKAVAREWDGLLPESKTRVVYNWTSFPADEGSAPGDGHVRSLFKETTFVATIVGSIVPFKRQMDAIRAVGCLVREGIDIGLLVVGPPLHEPYYNSLVKLVDENGWRAIVRFAGYTENARQLMRESDVTLVCSDSESFGRVTIESMAQGTPVIGADFGGTSEIIADGVDGLLFPPGDVACLTQRLRSLIEEPNLRLHLSRGATETAKRFCDAEAVMAPVVELLQGLRGKSNPSWPLASFIESGLSTFGAPDAIVSRTSMRHMARGLVKRVIRRIW